ncbi:MAG: haloacid dehalogenase-like hydrolase, partial [Pigmentiphaga sp.]
MKKLIPLAIAYDFDGTLAPGNMQEHAFLLEVHEKPADFWAEAKRIAADNDMDEILAYMHLMLQKARAAGVSIRRESFVTYGRGIAFFDGVAEWFDRIDAFGREHGVSVPHYVISSGMREMIAGTAIARHFKCVFASGYLYD